MPAYTRLATCLRVDTRIRRWAILAGLSCKINPKGRQSGVSVCEQSGLPAIRINRFRHIPTEVREDIFGLEAGDAIPGRCPYDAGWAWSHDDVGSGIPQPLHSLYNLSSRMVDDRSARRLE